MFTNDVTVKKGIVAVSRSCFPKSLSQKRREEVVAECKNLGVDIYSCQVTVENENDAMEALRDLKANGVNALVVFLGNFGPETPETLMAQKFDGPVMFCAAAEETKEDLYDGRGDAYCGMLNASYNLNLRNMKVYIPEEPVLDAKGNAKSIADFEPIAKVMIGLSSLKIISFGPRPQDFLACNAPIKPLYDIGVEIQENSELDLFVAFNEHKDDPRIPAIVEEMKKDFNCPAYPDAFESLAQYEITLLDWAEQNKGACEHVIFANKCWPSFQTAFKIVPCYVNGRLAAKGIPVSCEVDIYGVLTEYILYLVTGKAPALLDINNTVPKDLYESYKNEAKGYKANEMFMGFHCGNGSTCLLKSAKMGYQRIMKRDLEPEGEPFITRGTAEGDLITSPVTLFRLQGTADCRLTSYIAQGETLDIPSHSFGTIGVIAIPEMPRFYRHVLVEKNYPHHSGVGFEHCGKTLFEIVKLLGVEDISYNQPASLPYKTENPFA